MLNLPEYPLTKEEESKLMDHEDSYSCLFDSLAEWNFEVGMYGDASFGKPTIPPISYEGELKTLKNKLDSWNEECNKLKEEYFKVSEVVDEYIPF